MAASPGTVFMLPLVFFPLKERLFLNQTASGSAVLFLFIIFNFQLAEADFLHVIIDDATAGVSLHLRLPCSASPPGKQKRKQNF